jgi:ribosomal protein S18 acetylase RimI-like enzyme
MAADPGVSSGVTVRPAAAGDMPALGRLAALLVRIHHDFDPLRFIAPGPGTATGYARHLASQLGRADAIVLMAEQDGIAAGYTYAGIEGNDWMALRGPAGVVYDIIVDPGRRRAGIGRMLLEATIAELTARGAPRVVLSTAAANAVAQSLFAAAGFRRTMIEMTREIDDVAR